MGRLFVDKGQMEYLVVGQSWDDVAGWYWETYASGFETEEEAQNWINNQEVKETFFNI